MSPPRSAFSSRRSVGSRDEKGAIFMETQMHPSATTADTLANRKDMKICMFRRSASR
jgi:hypothetical protein